MEVNVSPISSGNDRNHVWSHLGIENESVCWKDGESVHLDWEVCSIDGSGGPGVRGGYLKGSQFLGLLQESISLVESSCT